MGREVCDSCSVCYLCVVFGSGGKYVTFAGCLLFMCSSWVGRQVCDSCSVCYFCVVFGCGGGECVTFAVFVIHVQ